ncbi:unnamed protein product [Brassica oleracea]
MFLDISPPSGEVNKVELEYKKLEDHCFSCHSLSRNKRSALSSATLWKTVLITWVSITFVR